jgi:hypothetical protein
VSRRAPWPLAILAVAACGPVQSIDSDFAGLRGQPVAAVVAKLGPPESQQPAANGTTFVWTDKVRDYAPVPMQKTTYDTGKATTVEVVERPELPQWKTCTLTVNADGTGTIVSVDRNGSGAACAPLARKVAG